MNRLKGFVNILSFTDVTIAYLSFHSIVLETQLFSVPSVLAASYFILESRNVCSLNVI
jgi:hypothetical protein